MRYSNRLAFRTALVEKQRKIRIHSTLYIQESKNTMYNVCERYSTIQTCVYTCIYIKCKDIKLKSRKSYAVEGMKSGQQSFLAYTSCKNIL